MGSVTRITPGHHEVLHAQRRRVHLDTRFPQP